MIEAIRELQALRASYRAAGKLREVKAIDRAISRLRARMRKQEVRPMS